jgi:hypothetical protein
VQTPPGPTGHWGPAPAIAFRPGIIPLRPLTLGDLYGAAVKAVRGNVGATVGLAVLTTLVFLVPATALGAWLGSQETATAGSDEPPVFGLVAASVPSFATSLSAIPLTGFVAWVVGQAVLGRRVSASQTWEATRSRLPQVIGASVVTMLVVLAVVGGVLVLPVLLVADAVRSSTGGSDLAVVVLLVAVAVLLAVGLAVFLSVRLAFVVAAVVLEKAGIRVGLARSWRLTGGSQFWRILGIRLLTGLLVGLAAQVLTVPLGLVGGLALVATSDPSQTFVWQAVVSGVTGLVTGALTTPFTAAVDALLYVDQRIRREAFDVQLVAVARPVDP